MKRIIVAAIAVLALAGCAAPAAQPDAREAVHAAVMLELVPEGVRTSAADGDAAAVEFIENVDGLADDLTAAILDDGHCDSAAYAAGLSDPTLQAAHERGCLVAEQLE